MKKVVKLVVAFSVLFAGAASASDRLLGSTYFEVKGRVVPSACSVKFSGGGVFDYGEIDRKQLDGSNGHFNRNLEALQPFSVICESPAKVSVKFVDNRLGTSTIGAEDNFGLGLTSLLEKFGYHYFSLSDSALKVFDGESQRSNVIYGLSRDGGATWGKESGTFVVAGGCYTPIDKNGLTPVAFTVFESAINSRISIKKNLRINDKEELSGLVTMELSYI